MALGSAVISQSVITGLSEAELPSTQEWHLVVEQVRQDLEHQQNLALAEVRRSLLETLACMKEQLQQEFGEVEQKCAAMIVAEGQKADTLFRHQSAIVEDVRSVRQLVESNSERLILAVNGVCREEQGSAAFSDMEQPQGSAEFSAASSQLAPNIKILQASADDLWELLRDHTSELLMNVQVEAEAKCTDLITEKLQRLQVEADAEYTKVIAASMKRFEATCAASSVANSLTGNLQRLESDMCLLQSTVQQCWERLQRSVPGGSRGVAGKSTGVGAVGRARQPAAGVPPSPQGLSPERRRPVAGREQSKIVLGSEGEKVNFKSLLAQFEQASAQCAAPMQSPKLAQGSSVTRRQTIGACQACRSPACVVTTRQDRLPLRQ